MMTAAAIPNLITCVRLVGCLSLPFLFASEHYTTVLIIYAILEFGDQLDGKLALLFNWKSQVGQFFDPFVDSLTHLIAFACLMSIGWVPLWVYLIFLFREFGLLFIRLLASLQGIELGGHMIGKIKALIHAMAIFFSLWFLVFDKKIIWTPQTWVLIAAIASGLSGVVYGIKYTPIIRKAFQS